MDRFDLADASWTLECLSDDVPGAIRAAGAIPAMIPGCVHTDLLAAGLIGDPHAHGAEDALAWIGRADWRYGCRFEWARTGRERVDLACDGLDTLSTLRLNGSEIGRSANMHRRNRFDVRDALREGRNELLIDFAAPVPAAEAEARRLGDLPRVRELPYNFLRKMACSFSWDWGPAMPTSGVWRPIRIESWSGARLGDVLPTTTLDGDRAQLDVRVQAEGRGTILGTLRDPDGATVGEAKGEVADGAVRLRFSLDAPRLWWPRGYGGQPLYALDLASDGDRRTVPIGLRTVALDETPDALGRRWAIRVNGRTIRLRGANWIPDDTLPIRVSVERTWARLRQAADAGMNAIRVWGGGIYPDDAFYEACDRLGLLVWQDFAFACADYPEAEPHETEIAAEARDNASRLACHPSLAIWCGGNESAWLHHAPEEADADGRTWAKRTGDRGWGMRYYADVLPTALAEADGTRPYLPNSPWSFGTDPATALPEDGAHPNDAASGTVHLWREWNERGPDHYRDHRPAFAAEWGHAGPPNWATLLDAVPPEGRTPLSPHMDYRIRAADGQRKLHERLREMFALPDDPDAIPFADWHAMAQLAQARAVRTGIEWLRSVGRCSGTLVWQLNDCWPVTSWALIDGAGRRKPAWFAARAAHADRLVTVQPRGKLDGTAATGLDAVLVNDTDARWSGMMVARAVGFEGAEREGHDEAFNVPPRSIHRVALPEGVWHPADPARELVTVRAGGAARAHWFHAADRLLRYDEPVLDVMVRSDRVRVTARTLVRDLLLRADMLDPHWEADDQLATLLPGESVTVRVPGATLEPRAGDAPALVSASRYGGGGSPDR